MANEEHLKILKQGQKTWNKWREDYPNIKPDLYRAGLWDKDYSYINFSNTILRYAQLQRSKLIYSNCYRADLRGASLTEVNLNHANLNFADLSNSNLVFASLISANLNNANLTGSCIYGISAWDVQLHKSKQFNLIITKEGMQNAITVDNLEIAQFVYLLLFNEKLRDILSTISNKAVLIIGRFTPERLAILHSIRNELRKNDYVPILFDFEKPNSRDFTETIITLAGLSKFIIADISQPKSSPLECQITIPNFMIPFIPIIQEGETPFSMFVDLSNKYDWVLETMCYKNEEELVGNLKDGLIKRAEIKYEELRLRKLKCTQPPISINKIT